MSGKIYIASMNMRGSWAERPENTIILNVTSMQGKENKNRRDFSPMSPFTEEDKEDNPLFTDFYNFEAFWQSGKVFESISHDKSLDWWKNVNSAKRRYPGSKGKNVLYAIWSHIDKKLDYIESRKKVYVPEYYELIRNREMIKYWNDKVKNGSNITIYDFDGPRTKDGDPSCLEVNLELLKEKINDTKYPFGHGYIVAGILKNIKPEHYT